MATYELEPCPCCGGEGKLKDVQGRRVRQGWVGCPACGLYISWKIDPAGAVRKWNTRAAAKTVSVALTPAAMRLLKYNPEIINMLAGRLSAKLDQAILYGDYPDVRQEGGGADG